MNSAIFLNLIIFSRSSPSDVIYEGVAPVHIAVIVLHTGGVVPR
jgi:hypothetical protein